MNQYSIHKHLSFISYNCQHADDVKLPYLNELFSECDFLFLQEHGLYKSQFDFFNKVSKGNVGMHGVSALDEREILKGRPHRGVMILWHLNVMCKVTPINTNFDSFCAVIVDLEGKSLLLVCVYMPCDDRCRDQNIREYIHVAY